MSVFTVQYNVSHWQSKLALGKMSAETSVSFHCAIQHIILVLLVQVSDGEKVSRLAFTVQYKIQHIMVIALGKKSAAMSVSFHCATQRIIVIVQVSNGENVSRNISQFPLCNTMYHTDCPSQRWGKSQQEHQPDNPQSLCTAHAKPTFLMHCAMHAGIKSKASPATCVSTKNTTNECASVTVTLHYKAFLFQKHSTCQLRQITV